MPMKYQGHDVGVVNLGHNGSFIVHCLSFSFVEVIEGLQRDQV